MSYENSIPTQDKFIFSDGSIRQLDGTIIQQPNDFNIQRYNQAEPIPAKFLMSDGSIQDVISGGGSVRLQEKVATSNGIITPDSGYDGLSKVTVNVSGESNYYTHLYELQTVGEVELIEHSVEKEQYGEDDFRFLPVDRSDVYRWILSKKELDGSDLGTATSVLDAIKLLQEQDSSVFLVAFDSGGEFFLLFNNGEETLELSLVG